MQKLPWLQPVKPFLCGARKWQDRVALLRKAADMIDQRTFEIGAMMAMEVGKNRMEALGDVAETADLIRYSCYQMERTMGISLRWSAIPWSDIHPPMSRIAPLWGLVGDQPLQLPVCSDRWTGWRGLGDRQHDRDQAGYRHALGGTHAGRMLPRCRCARGCLQLRHRTWADAGPGLDREPRGRRGNFHRLL
jgi:hypothetical protein